MFTFLRRSKHIEWTDEQKRNHPEEFEDDQANTGAAAAAGMSSVLQKRGAAAFASSVPKKASAEQYKYADGTCTCQIKNCDEVWEGDCGKGYCSLCFCEEHMQVHRDRCAGVCSKYQ